MELCDILHELYHYCYQSGELNKSARQGIISLLPKGNKNPNYLKNWRPLTLLNLDYKILAKILANRLKVVLPNIIGDQQTGFIENRQISENIVKTMDIIAYASVHRKKQLIVTIDFEKCFDKIAYCAIFGSMEYFGMCTSFQKWVKLFFTKFTAATQNNGYTSSWFEKGRSINQGCPISPYVFLLSGEILTHKLYLNENIKGITMGELRLLVSQFADDTVLFVNYDLGELQAVLDTLDKVESHTGLKISYDKTTIYRVGSLKDSDAQLYTSKNLVWSSGDVDLLGVTIENGPPTSGGYESTIRKMKEVCNTWVLRQLTLMGKVLVVNALMGSLFVYKMQVLPNLTKSQLKSIDSIIKKFLWGKGRPKIPLKVLRNPKKYGGLKLVDLEARQTALKVSWVQRIHKQTSFQYAYLWFNGMGHLLWQCNLHYMDAISLFPQDTHWKRVLVEWCRLHFHDHFNGNEVRKQVLLLNSNIKIGGSPVYFDQCVVNGLLYFSDLLNGNVLKTFTEIENQFGKCLNWYSYRQLCSAIPKIWFTLLESTTSKDQVDYLTVEDIVLANKLTQMVYNFIKTVKDKPQVILQKYLFMYCEKVHMVNDPQDYYKLFENLYKLSKVTKLRNFQYRMLLFKIYPNTTLHRWAIKDSSKCEFCNEEQMLKHLFWECVRVKPLYQYICELFESEIELTFEKVFDCSVIQPTEHVANLIILVTKMYIFRSKCKNEMPRKMLLENEILNRERIDRCTSIREGSAQKHANKWGILFPELIDQLNIQILQEINKV